MSGTWMEQSAPRLSPMEEVIFVKNEGTSTESWLADGKTVVLEPGETQPLPRWVYHLGLNFPGRAKTLRELHPKEGTAEYERAQQEKAERELAAEEAKLEEKRREVAAKREALLKKEPPPDPARNKAGKGKGKLPEGGPLEPPEPPDPLS